MRITNLDVKIVSPRRRYDYYRYYQPSKPIPTEDGIKAKTKRGDFGQSWWGKQFIAALERFGWENRLKRGKRYARKGQVLSINIAKGKITAKVQGSSRTPYSVSIAISIFSARDWKKIIQELSNQALYAAELLAGEMPKDIITQLDNIGYNILPKTQKDLKTYCSCPDSANPCKHIAAVYYLVSEQFDENPFLFFKLRGMEKEHLLEALRDQRIQETPKKKMGLKDNSTSSQRIEQFLASKEGMARYWGTTDLEVLKELGLVINFQPIDLFNQILLSNPEYTDQPEEILIDILKIMKRQLKPIYDRIQENSQ